MLHTHAEEKRVRVRPPEAKRSSRQAGLWREPSDFCRCGFAAL